MTLEEGTDGEYQCQGWREFLAEEDEAAPLVPEKKPKCPRCHDGGGKLGRATLELSGPPGGHPGVDYAGSTTAFG